MSEQISVLIIDDDRIIRELLHSILSKKGYKIYMAEDGPSGLRSAHEEDIDIILLDWMMPGMNGLEVLRQLKKGNTTKNVPVIMLTGKDSGCDVDQAVFLGVVDYIVKPFDLSTIDQTIREKLGKTTEVKTIKSYFTGIFSKGS
jgi:DNA-binding response OmpR family regulator